MLLMYINKNKQQLVKSLWLMFLFLRTKSTSDVNRQEAEKTGRLSEEVNVKEKIKRQQKNEF